MLPSNCAAPKTLETPFERRFHAARRSIHFSVAKILMGDEAPGLGWIAISLPFKDIAADPRGIAFPGSEKVAKGTIH